MLVVAESSILACHTLSYWRLVESYENTILGVEFVSKSIVIGLDLYAVAILFKIIAYALTTRKA